jgi:hypothetical protein
MQTAGKSTGCLHFVLKSPFRGFRGLVSSLQNKPAKRPQV